MEFSHYTIKKYNPFDNNPPKKYMQHAIIIQQIFMTKYIANKHHCSPDLDCKFMDFGSIFLRISTCISATIYCIFMYITSELFILTVYLYQDLQCSFLPYILMCIHLYIHCGNLYTSEYQHGSPCTSV